MLGPDSNARFSNTNACFRNTAENVYVCQVFDPEKAAREEQERREAEKREAAANKAEQARKAKEEEEAVVPYQSHLAC
jgi:hypothetical protein